MNAESVGDHGLVVELGIGLAHDLRLLGQRMQH